MRLQLLHTALRTYMRRSLLSFIVLLLFLSTCGCGIREARMKEASYHYQMGLSYLGENNPTGALIELTEAEKLTPDDPELLNYLGMAYYRKNRYDIAEQKYLRALELRPNYSEARNNLGVNYLEMKRWNDAVAVLKQVTDDLFYKDQVSATINLGLAYFGKGDMATALSIFRSVVGSNPRDPRARLHLGKVYQAQDRLDLAIEEYRKATEYYKDYAMAWYQLGIAYLEKQEKADSRLAFREVLRVAPDSEIGQLAREHLDMLK